MKLGCSRLFMVLAVAAVLFPASVSASANGVRVALSSVESPHEGVTLDVHSAPIRDVLATVAASTGVRFRLDKQVGGALTVSMRHVPVATALRRLLKNYNYSVRFSGSAAAANTPVLVTILRSGMINGSGLSFDEIGAASLKHGNTSGSAHNMAARGLAMGVTGSRFRGGAQYASVSVGGGRMLGGDVGRTALSLPGPAGLYASVAQAHKALAQAHHEQVATLSAIQQKKADLIAQLAAPGADKHALLKQVKVLDAQAMRSKQASSQKILKAQRKVQQLALVQSAYKRPDQQKVQTVARNSVQHRKFVQQSVARVQGGRVKSRPPSGQRGVMTRNGQPSGGTAQRLTAQQRQQSHVRRGW